MNYFLWINGARADPCPWEQVSPTFEHSPQESRQIVANASPQ